MSSVHGICCNREHKSDTRCVASLCWAAVAMGAYMKVSFMPSWVAMPAAYCLSVESSVPCKSSAHAILRGCVDPMGLVCTWSGNAVHVSCGVLII